MIRLLRVCPSKNVVHSSPNHQLLSKFCNHRYRAHEAEFGAVCTHWVCLRLVFHEKHVFEVCFAPKHLESVENPTWLKTACSTFGVMWMFLMWSWNWKAFPFSLVLTSQTNKHVSERAPCPGAVSPKLFWEYQVQCWRGSNNSGFVRNVVDLPVFRVFVLD